MEEWECEAAKRSNAVKELKDVWTKTGKSLSHLNRQDLSRESQEAMKYLVTCADTMRSKEPAYYLNDDKYKKALQDSLDAKQKCVDISRKVFSTVSWNLYDGCPVTRKVRDSKGSWQ